MRRIIATACVLTMISAAAWAGQSAPQQTPPTAAPIAKSKKKIASPKPNVPAPVPESSGRTVPQLPATLMNSAPVKPNVTMAGGMLTIDAPNSTLSDVLSEVHRVTGAAIEGASPTERVAVRLGPGKPEQVISALLRGTPYDYVILGSLGRPDVVTRVLLTQAGQAGGEPPQDHPSDEAMRRSQEASAPSAEDMAPPPDDVQPNADSEPEQAQPQAQPQADQNQTKTPEQLFRELQQMEQLKQQQQQQR
jgi:hypothetical protein